MNRRPDRRANGRNEAGQRRIRVKEEDKLLSFLFKSLEKEHSKTAIKSLLGRGQVSVNGEATTQFDTPVSPNDLVSVSYGRGKVVFNHPMLRLLWEDEFLIVVSKKQGLLSVANMKVKEKTAYQLLSDYVKRSDPRNKIFILHRLERDVSGVMIFAKNKGVQAELHANWNRVISNFSYIAVVEGKPEENTGLLTSFGKADERMYITSADSGTETIMRYTCLQSNEQYSLVELKIESGHRSIIREQMESLGTPIVGDERFGAQTNPIGRLALHAHKLFFFHPVTNEEMRFETPVPSNFKSLLKK